jgi:hypothetical protein
VFAACSNDDDESGSSALPELTDPEDVCSGMDDLDFMKYCYEHFDVNGDAKVSKTEAAAVTSMYIHDSDITSLKGIGYFTNLQDLDIECHGLTSLDLSKNTNLQELHITSYGLTSLDLGKNTNLQKLYIGCDVLTTLDLSKNTNLQDLDISCDGLTSLDVESNLKLTHVGITSSKSMTLLKLPSSIIKMYLYSGLNALTTLYCGATTPPYGGFLGNCESLSKIYVPESAVSAYKSAKYWRDYASLIYGY